jgi:GNAT superfamily N-acetyltransferase
MSKADKGRIIVRRMERTDIDPVLELDECRDLRKSKVEYKIKFNDLVALDPGGPLSFCFVAELDGIIIGFILARLTYMGVPFYEFCVINAIVVRDDYQGRGVGRKMIDKVLEKCRAAEIHMVRAIFPEENERVRTVVESLGFSPSPIVNYDIAL